MKRTLALTAASLVLSTALVTSAFSAEPGFVDFGKLVGPEKGDFVEINLGKGLLKLASVFAKGKNAEAADIISGLSRVRVNVVGLDDTNRTATTERIAAVREELTRQGWEQIVSARGKKQEDVAVFLKQRDGEVIEGIVVTVIDDRKKEAVFVNVVGNIKSEHLGMLGEHLDIPQLRGAGKPAKG